MAGLFAYILKWLASPVILVVGSYRTSGVELVASHLPRRVLIGLGFGLNNQYLAGFVPVIS